MDFNGTLIRFGADYIFMPGGDDYKHKGFVARGEKALVGLLEEA